MKNSFLLFCFVAFSYTIGLGQNNVGVDSLLYNNSSRAVNSYSDKLLKSIKENKPDEEIARNYCDLAKALSTAKDYTKAEYYMNRAIQTESEIRGKKNLGEYYRELGKIQELQNNFETASASFSKACSLSNDSLLKQLNRNDAARLKQKSLQDQLPYLNQNGAILSNSSNQIEKFQNYNQLANTNIALNNNDAALDNYKSALNTVPTNTGNSVQIHTDMVNLMVAANDLPSAILVQQSIMSEPILNSDVGMKVSQMRNLSALLFKMDSTAAGLRTLKESYHLAIEKGNFQEAKKSLIALTEFYKNNKQEEEASTIYSDFVAGLDNLLSRDSSLIDRKLFLVNEGKIADLEQQQTLKDQLIQGKTTSNFILLGSVVVLSLLLLLIAKAFLSIRIRNKKIALQSLRREMNPHFIFNSLNSVNQFIASNNEREANKYLTSYSSLMRNIMENSNKDYVTLNVEIDQLKKYLELEKLRFADKFDYEIEIDPTLNPETALVPNMLLQPNLENAIWHGLRYKESPGLLKLKFQKKENKIVVTIDDNGIGLTESKNIKTKNQKLHESLGLKNVEERIRLLNDIYKTKIHFEIVEKSGIESGVVVKIEW